MARTLCTTGANITFTAFVYDTDGDSITVNSVSMTEKDGTTITEPAWFSYATGEAVNNNAGGRMERYFDFTFAKSSVSTDGATAGIGYRIRIDTTAGGDNVVKDFYMKVTKPTGVPDDPSGVGTVTWVLDPAQLIFLIEDEKPRRNRDKWFAVGERTTRAFTPVAGDDPGYQFLESDPAVNSHPVVRIDGQTHVQYADMPTGFTNDIGTLFFVAAIECQGSRSNTWNGQRLMGCDSSSTGAHTDSPHIEYSTGMANYYRPQYLTWDPGNGKFIYMAYEDGGYHVYTVRVNGLNNDTYVRIDGYKWMTQTGGSNWDVADWSARLGIGHYAPTYQDTIKLAQAVGYASALTDQQMSDVEQWLAKKFNLPTATTLESEMTTVYTNLHRWYKVNAINDTDVTQVDGSNRLIKWIDSSGNAADLTKQTGSAAPLYNATGYNGGPTIQFDGVDEMLQAASFTAIASGTALAVVKCTYDGTNGTQTLLELSNHATNRLRIRVLDSTNKYMRVEGGASSESLHAGRNQLEGKPSQFGVVEFTWADNPLSDSGTGALGKRSYYSTNTCYVYGSLNCHVFEDNTNRNHAGDTTSTATQIFLGSDKDEGEYCKFEILELMVFDTLLDEKDVVYLCSHLGWKHGLDLEAPEY